MVGARVEQTESADIQDRDQRVALLASAFDEASRTSGVVRIDFGGTLAYGAAGCRIDLDDLPAGRVVATTYVELRYEDGLDVPAGRSRALRSAGWPKIPRRSWEFQTADHGAIGGIVDDLQFVFDASSVPPDQTWRIRVVELTPARIEARRRQESWVEDATVQQIRDRLRRLAGLRGGRIAVRYAIGPSTVLGLSARRRRGVVEVGIDDLGSMRGHVLDLTTQRVGQLTVPELQLDARPVFASVEDALARLSPPGSGGTLCVRLELLDAPLAENDAEDIGIVTWFIVLVIAGIYARVVGTAAATGLLGAVGRVFSRSFSIGDLVTLLAVFATSALVVSELTTLLWAIGNARSWRYAVMDRASAVRRARLRDLLRRDLPRRGVVGAGRRRAVGPLAGPPSAPGGPRNPVVRLPPPHSVWLPRHARKGARRSALVSRPADV